MKKALFVVILLLLALFRIFANIDAKNIKTVQPYLQKYKKSDKVGIITLNPSDFYSLTAQQIYDFISKNVAGNKSGWTSFTICCSDGFGLQFPGCQSSYGQYGRLDDCYRTVEPVVGWLTKKGTTFGYKSDDGRMTSFGYVYDKNTKTIHYPWCSAVSQIANKNLEVKKSISNIDKVCKICMSQ